MLGVADDIASLSGGTDWEVSAYYLIIPSPPLFVNVSMIVKNMSLWYIYIQPGFPPLGLLFLRSISALPRHISHRTPHSSTVSAAHLTHRWYTVLVRLLWSATGGRYSRSLWWDTQPLHGTKVATRARHDSHNGLP